MRDYTVKNASSSMLNLRDHVLNAGDHLKKKIVLLKGLLETYFKIYSFLVGLRTASKYFHTKMLLNMKRTVRTRSLNVLIIVAALSSLKFRTSF